MGGMTGSREMGLQAALLCGLLLLAGAASAKDLRVSADALAAGDGAPGRVIIDARSQVDYAAAHVVGAVNFPVALTYADRTVDGRVAPPAGMQRRLRALGIDSDSPVVVYDGGDLADAARLFWVLEVYGIADVKVLDRGFDYWLRRGYPVSTAVPKVTESRYVAAVDHHRLASKFTTRLATLDRNKLVIDARSRGAYRGETSSAERFGHIPTAINIPAAGNFEEAGGTLRIKPLDRLQALYRDLPRDRKVVVYCAVGRTSAANYLALRELGFDVANYDASWREWGNDPQLPIDR